MKLKYLFASLAAVLAVFTSCSEDFEPTYLDAIRVSSSYVALPDSGTTTIDLETQGAWAITCCDTCTEMNEAHLKKQFDGLTISPLKGEAGKQKVSFTVGKKGFGKTANLFIHCNGKTQRISVIQGEVVVSEATCKEVCDGPDGKTYRVKGICKSIVNTTYGNWYLQDETGEVYIYGTLDAKGATKNFASLGLEVGDEVTVEGPKTTYNGTVELVDVSVVKISKSLVKVDSLSVQDAVFPVEGGDITAYLTCKGEGVGVEIEGDAKEWLSIASTTSGANPTVTLRADANPGGDRSGKVIFKTVSGGKEYTSELAVTQNGAIIDASVADFLAAEVGDTQYRLTGVITKVAKAAYGNVYIRDYSGEAYIYGIGSKGDFEALGLKEGDIVTVVGKRAAYKDSPQMSGGQYETHIPVTPCTISEFIAKPNSKTDYYMVTGDITNIEKREYGNLYISDGENELYVYGCYAGWGATGDFRKGFLDQAGINVGDKLTMIGYKDTYKDKIELCGGIYFSHIPANDPE